MQPDGCGLPLFMVQWNSISKVTGFIDIRTVAERGWGYPRRGGENLKKKGLNGRMKSNEVALSGSLSCAVEALEEVERASAQAGLNREQTNVMRLLTEEMIAMTTDILDACTGALWMEWEGRACELHLTAVAPIEKEAKAAFIAASKAKVNTPVKGLKNKISALLAGMLSSEYCPELYDSIGAGFVGEVPVGMPSLLMAPTWSLAAYTESRKKEQKDAELEGVERSILTGMADDVVVSVKSHWVELVVRKAFAAPLPAAMP